MKRIFFLLILILRVGYAKESIPSDLDMLLKTVQKAMKEKNDALALSASLEAVTKYPTNATAKVVRARALDDLGKTNEAILAYEKAIAIEPKNGESYQNLGFLLFKTGKVKESLANFDKYLELEPRAAPYHWQRGLACYYAEEYDQGRRQFELHAGVNRADVEVATWHFACVAKLKGVEQARANLLPVQEDARIPMMEVYRFYQGKSSIKKVLDAAKSAPPEKRQDCLFYAYLYLALYHEVNGEELLSMSEIKEAIRNAPLVDYMADTAFVHRNLREAQTPTLKKVAPIQGIQRSGLGNFFEKIKSGQEVKIAYFGGSITAAQGWRVKTMAWFKKQYPQAKFSEINAAIGGTGSDLGVFRFRRDVLDKKPDLVFVEFAVNDAGASPSNIWKALEGVVLQAWEQNPNIDFCMVYTFTTDLQPSYDQNTDPRAVAADELFADYYGIPSINVSIKTAKMIRDKKMIPKAEGKEVDGVPSFSKDGVHPSDFGHGIYTEVITDEISDMEKTSIAAAHILGTPYIAENWKEAKMESLNRAKLSVGWTSLSATNEFSTRFSNRLISLEEATKPGETLTFSFKGTAAKIYDIIGPDSGKISVQVDNKPPVIVPRFDNYCSYYRLSTLTIGENLSDGIHKVKITLLSEKPNKTEVTNNEKDKPGFEQSKYDGIAFRPGALLVVGEMQP
ncbi:MAG: acyl-CoA thioesterase [Verrucomicrobiales bacterium]|nr:acyl-CoA thioesterase [Verrucomicrobiales bacterium]